VWLTDAALAFGLLLVGLRGTRPAGGNQPLAAEPDARAYALVAVAAVVLAVRRRYPRSTLAVATLATAPYLLFDYPYGPILISYAVAVYTVAAHLPIRRATIASAVSLAALLTHVFYSVGGSAGLVPGPSWPAGTLTTSGCGSRRRCTTWSATDSRRSTCRRRSRCTCCRSDPSRRRRR
jgi:hypothetical protein